MSILSIHKMFNTFINVFYQFTGIAWIYFYILKFIKRNPMEFNIKISFFNVLMSNEFSIKRYLYLICKFNYVIKTNLMARLIAPWEEYFSNTLDFLYLNVCTNFLFEFTY